MGGEDDFEPVLGRIRASPSRRGSSYLRRVLGAAAAGGVYRAARGRRFDGSRIGRGAGIGRLLGASRAPGGARGRRAIVKTRLVRLAGRGLGGARAHLRYVQRDGVQDANGGLFGPGDDAPDPRDFLDRCAGDRHQFRLILSPEDGARYDSLEPLVRRFMAQMERDLGTELQWVAAEHRDTGQPHAHVILRGVDERGANLVIARDYIARGMRERLAELVTLDLGPRQDQEIEQSLRSEVRAERLTSLDRGLLRDMAPDRTVLAALHDPSRQALRWGRLRHLEHLGLAESAGNGRWRLATGFEETLRTLGERGDIIRTMQRELSRSGLKRGGADLAVASLSPGAQLVGRLVARGLADEAADTHFLIVDAVDGRVHHVPIGRADAVEPISEGSILRLQARDSTFRPSDQRIAAIAADHQGIYSAGIHRTADAAASPRFIAGHERRLEALRRAGAPIRRFEDGRWDVGGDYLVLAAAHEAMLARRSPVTVEILSPLPLEQLPGLAAATWLDRELASDAPIALRDAGFGREVRSALEARRRWLLAEGLALEEEGRTVLRPGALAGLRQRELAAAGARLSGELRLPFAAAGDGPLSGVLVRRVDLASGRFALLATEREFTLVPWRPVLEPRIGREIAGMVRGPGVSWSFTRGRGLAI